ncbi:type II toxin-antitoxin system RelE/ParE family toxin [Salana multivorans]
MKLRAAFHPAALEELADAIERYDLGGQGRGARLRSEFDRVLDHCLEWPALGASVEIPESQRAFRRVKVSGSHYSLIYFVDSGVLTVVAVAHERRRPLYWAVRS